MFCEFGSDSFQVVFMVQIKIYFLEHNYVGVEIKGQHAKIMYAREILDGFQAVDVITPYPECLLVFNVKQMAAWFVGRRFV